MSAMGNRFRRKRAFDRLGDTVEFDPVLPDEEFEDEEGGGSADYPELPAEIVKHETPDFDLVADAQLTDYEREAARSNETPPEDGWDYICAQVGGDGSATGLDTLPGDEVVASNPEVPVAKAQQASYRIQQAMGDGVKPDDGDVKEAEDEEDTRFESGDFKTDVNLRQAVESKTRFPRLKFPSMRENKFFGIDIVPKDVEDDIDVGTASQDTDYNDDPVVKPGYAPQQVPNRDANKQRSGGGRPVDEIPGVLPGAVPSNNVNGEGEDAPMPSKDTDAGSGEEPGVFSRDALDAFLSDDEKEEFCRYMTGDDRGGESPTEGRPAIVTYAQLKVLADR